LPVGVGDVEITRRGGEKINNPDLVESEMTVPVHQYALNVNKKLQGEGERYCACRWE
jgi:hypothetical protein